MLLDMLVNQKQTNKQTNKKNVPISIFHTFYTIMGFIKQINNHLPGQE